MGYTNVSVESYVLPLTFSNAVDVEASRTSLISLSFFARAGMMCSPARSDPKKRHLSFDDVEGEDIHFDSASWSLTTAPVPLRTERAYWSLIRPGGSQFSSLSNLWRRRTTVYEASVRAIC